jgi:hypothetical protein
VTGWKSRRGMSSVVGVWIASMCMEEMSRTLSVTDRDFFDISLFFANEKQHSQVYHELQSGNVARVIT